MCPRTPNKGPFRFDETPVYEQRHVASAQRRFPQNTESENRRATVAITAGDTTNNDNSNTNNTNHNTTTTTTTARHRSHLSSSSQPLWFNTLASSRGRSHVLRYSQTGLWAQLCARTSLLRARAAVARLVPSHMIVQRPRSYSEIVHPHTSIETCVFRCAGVCGWRRARHSPQRRRLAPLVALP